MLLILLVFTKTGMFVYDPGFKSTASCSSEITFIDGEKGVLLHRGYEIEELAEKSDYYEVCYLLLNGDLPDNKIKKNLLIYLLIIQCYTSKFSDFTVVLEEIRTQWQ